MKKFIINWFIWKYNGALMGLLFLENYKWSKLKKICRNMEAKFKKWIIKSNLIGKKRLIFNKIK